MSIGFSFSPRKVNWSSNTHYLRVALSLSVTFDVCLSRRNVGRVKCQSKVGVKEKAVYNVLVKPLSRLMTRLCTCLWLGYLRTRGEAETNVGQVGQFLILKGKWESLTRR